MPPILPSTPKWRALGVLLLGVWLGACRAEPVGGAEPYIAGTWQVLADSDMPLSRQGQRYAFARDSTLHISRPRSLGPASTILAVYDVRGDTLLIRSEFDSETMMIDLRGDTLLLDPVGGGLSMTLVRIGDAPVTTDLVPFQQPDTAAVYSPPSDLPLHELPPN